MALEEPLLLCGLLLLPHATLNSEQANGLKGHLPSEYLQTLKGLAKTQQRHV